MEAVVVAARENGVCLAADPHAKLVVNAFVLDHIAQLGLESLVENDTAHRFFGVADIPDLH